MQNHTLIYELRVQRFLGVVNFGALVLISITAIIVGTTVRALPVADWEATASYSTGDHVVYDGNEWEATAAIGSEQAPLGNGTGSNADQNLLMSRRIGFGAAATGGSAGEIYHVTTSASSGPGSLKDAVSGDDPRWVVFDRDMTIDISDLPADNGITVGSNKTIDGRGHKISVTGHNHYGFKIDHAENVIIENLKLYDFGDTTKTVSNNLPDAINIESSKNVWLDHLDLSQTGDKVVSINSGSQNITVSWSHFHDQEQTFQIGSQSTDSPENVGTIPKQTVTVHHNWFDHTGYRNPVGAFGQVHSFNNWLDGWKTYGMRSERTNDMVSENDIFTAETDSTATLTRPGDDGCNDAKTKCDGRYGYLRISGALKENGAKAQGNTAPGSVCKVGSLCEQLTPAPTTPTFFMPSSHYYYSASPANGGLKTLLTNYSGPQTQWRMITPPDNPSDPTDPTGPTNPSDPTGPVNPTPTDPTPTTPTEPGSGIGGGGTTSPITSSTPDSPSASSQPPQDSDSTSTSQETENTPSDSGSTNNDHSKQTNPSKNDTSNPSTTMLNDPSPRSKNLPSLDKIPAAVATVASHPAKYPLGFIAIVISATGFVSAGVVSFFAIRYYHLPAFRRTKPFGPAMTYDFFHEQKRVELPQTHSSYLSHLR